MSETCCERPVVAMWMIGWWPHKDERGREHRHDPNQRNCMNCGKKWFVPCWCGWMNGEMHRELRIKPCPVSAR